ncbi:hypothetical protein [Trueperella pyogenes]|uniref:hypothetical protein n=1 Tax=Trueperella pyogenes TaxID=1661 RepID=UPI000F865FD8|nr:hypothetical protein [Trueperella pyogenes]MCI7689204.1 hypothetical protein [Trueperella pyogenes]
MSQYESEILLPFEGEVWVQDYDFWGIPVRCLFSSQAQLDWLNYYFQDYISDCTPKVFIALRAKGSAEASTSLFKFDILLSNDGLHWDMYSSYENLEAAPAIIPPFGLKGFREEFKTLHGAALRTCEGDGLVISGASTAGKTTLMLALLEVGMAFVADDIVVVQTVNGKQFLRPFSRPLGIRANTAERFKTHLLPEHLNRTFRTTYGLSYPVHINDLPFRKCLDLVEWRWTLILNKAKHQESVELGPWTLSLSYPDPVESLEWITHTVQSWLETRKSVV